MWINYSNHPAIHHPTIPSRTTRRRKAWVSHCQGVTREREDLRECPDGNAHRPCRIPSLPSSPGEREGSGPEIQGCRDRAGTGHPSHGPSLLGCSACPSAPVPPTTTPPKAMRRARLVNVFPKGRAGAESQRITLEENCQLPADVRVGQGSRVLYLLTSFLPLPALIALWGMDIISSCPHLGRMKEEWRVDPRWFGDPGRRRECTRMGQTS